jgi:hypothetical protein
LSSQIPNAKSFEDCLTNAGVPAQLDIQSDGRAHVSFVFDGYGSLAFRNAEGSVELNGVDPSTWEAFVDEHPDGPLLLLNGDDRSQDYSGCLSSSGYVEPSFTLDPATELAEKQRRAEVTNAWVACARQHGFPSLSDAGPIIADGEETMPTVTLPADTTVDQLRLLLDSCPNFDATKAAEALAKGEAVLSPSISVAGLVGPGADLGVLSLEEQRRAEEIASLLSALELSVYSSSEE